MWEMTTIGRPRPGTTLYGFPSLSCNVNDGSIASLPFGPTADILPKGFARHVKESRDIRFGVRERQIQLRRHRIQEDAPAEESKQEGARPLPVGGRGRPIVHDLCG